MTPCPQPSMTVRVRLTDLFRRIAHGTQHMRAVDLAIRLVLLVYCLVVATWMISRGELLWPLVDGAAGALSLATDAVELYAGGAVCGRLTELEKRCDVVTTCATVCGRVPTYWSTRLRAGAALLDHLLCHADSVISAALDIRPLRHTFADAAAWLGRTWRAYLHRAHVRKYGPGRGLIAVVLNHPKTEKETTHG